MPDFLKNNLYVFIVLAAAIAGAIIMPMIKRKSAAKISDAYLSAHPDAVKVYLQNSSSLISRGSIQVYSVNNEAAAVFYEGLKTGFYLAPGTNQVNLNHSSTRPGVFYRSVTTTTGVTTVNMTVEAGCRYSVAYKKSESGFVLSRI